jgi:group II intron reverse transcriptase/maturase
MAKGARLTGCRETEVRVMRNANVILAIHEQRGRKGLPLERVYKHLFNPEFFLQAYGKIYRNAGATTKGATEETVDGMCLKKVHKIIALLKMQRYEWTPVRRTEIPKANGKMRPLGIPTWGDKLVQEVLRTLLESYYEQRFRKSSHGFRPGRSCQTALLEIAQTWKGTVWFIEGDIKGCFDNIDHSVLLEIIRRDVHDGRVVQLIDGLLRAGYMEDWRYCDSCSGTPQGGIISPLLANIYLNELDRFVEDTLRPAYTKGKKRSYNPEYERVRRRIGAARKGGTAEELKALLRQRRQLASVDAFDPEYRRLRYVRYADDFLLGFAGPREEAVVIRERLAEFLETRLKLSLSKEKTLITHAVDEKAKFLGYEVTASRCNTLLDKRGVRSTNGRIALLMPRTAVTRLQAHYSEKGKAVHRSELLADSDYTIVQRYQSVLRGLYNFYCMATNVSARMSTVKWVLETSLTKTLAAKHQCSVRSIYSRHQKVVAGYRTLQVEMERPGKKPLVATFGGIPLKRKPEGMIAADFHFKAAWHTPANKRSEAVMRMLAGRCELCGAKEPVQMHHIRKLADIDRPGRRPKAGWEKVMIARRRKQLAVCEACHRKIHAGKYDGSRLDG